MQTNPRAKGQKKKKNATRYRMSGSRCYYSKKKISQPNSEWQLIEQTLA